MECAESMNCQSEQLGLNGNTEFMASKSFVLGIRS